MRTLVVTQAEVPKLLPMAECIEVMASTMAALARGETILPLRQILWLPERIGALGPHARGDPLRAASWA